MTIEVDVNGTVVEFPDGTPKAVMQTALQNKFGKPDPDQVPIGTTGTPDIGRGTALALGLAQGGSANFADETLGVMAAAGKPVQAAGMAGLPATFLKGAAKLLYEKVSGTNDPKLSGLITGEQTGGEATQRYQQAKDYINEQAKAAQEQYPGTYLVGNVGGAIASPITRVISVPGALPAGSGFVQAMRQAIPYGAKTGAVYGAAAGAGEGETLTERAVNAAEGGTIGAVAGAVVPPVVEGAIRGAGVVARPIVTAIRGIRDPEGEAARRGITAIRRDVATGNSGAQTDDEILRYSQGLPRQGNQPVMNVDIGGETTRALARSSANTSPEGRAILSQSINDRFEQQAPRMAEWFNNTFNFATPQARERAIRDVAQNVYEPRYAQAYRAVASRSLWDNDLEQLAQAPEVQRAIRTATVNARNWAVRDGLPPPRGALVIDNSGTMPRTVLRRTTSGANPGGNTYQPSLQLWDYVKRALDRSGDPPSRDLARTLREHLDTLVPEYRAAREAAQPTRFFDGAHNAYEAGQNFINRGQRYGVDAQRQIARMTPEEQRLFQDGYTSSMIERIERSPDRRNLLNSIAQSPAARTEIQTALGPQRWQELEATLRTEGIMELARTSVQGNSTTARQLMELGLAGGAGGLDYLATGDPSAAMHAALVWGAARGHRAIDARVARHVAQLLTSQDPQAFQRGVQMIARNNGMMNQLRRVDAQLARIGAQQSPRPVLQLPGTGNAENDQQGVPRPPSQ